MSLTSCDFRQVYADCEKVVECKCVVESVLEAAVKQTQSKNMVDYDGEALNRDIQEYKQLLWVMKDENTLLKVKLQRLEDILKKKNRIVDTHYLGTHNKLLFKEAMHQFTHRIETLQSENIELKEELLEKDATIRKLRKQINTYSAYKPSTTTLTTKKKPSSASVSIGSRTSRITTRSHDFDDSAAVKIKDILDTNENTLIYKVNTEVCPVDVDTDRAVSCSLLSDTPHEEIEKLHSGFKDILEEVGKLKDSVGEITEQHARTMKEVRTREKDLMARLYDKHEEMVYRDMQKPVGMRKLRVNIPSSVGPAAPSGDRERPKKSPRTSYKKTTTAFARITPANQSKVPAKQHKNKKHDAFAIRTVSRSSLHDEVDMRLYIDEVLHDMNRST